MNCNIELRSVSLKNGISLAALAAAVGLAGFASAGAFAATGAAATLPAAEADADIAEGDIIVSGSRIVRDGYEAPTPTMVLGEAEIKATAPNNIADLVNRLPSLTGSATPRTNLGQISNGGTGINALNLRNLGATRTLILLDGKRVPVATINTALVDVNFLPNMLIKRVDVVTGGASAAWGSDAVAGVVNFVLDKEFTGFKADVQGGITTHGDDENYKVGFAAGTAFADGRGHVLVSAEHAYSAGLKGLPRDWYTGAKLFANPAYNATNGQPQFIVRRDAGFTTVAPGAIVTAGPLRGLYFGDNGTPGQLNYGGIVSDPFMVGGDSAYTDFGKGIQDMDPRITRQTLFTRLSYDLTDGVQAYGEFAYGGARTALNSTPQFNFGGITIQRDNAFLPDAIRARMGQLGLASLNVGSWNGDLGGIRTKTRRQQFRYLAGLTGKFDMLGGGWNWDVSVNRNISKIRNSALTTITQNYRNAIDAVYDGNGAIVCRSSLTNPNNGCVPYNILGTGTASDAAKAYVLGTTSLRGKLTQDIIAASLGGEPFSTWAGPVSVTLGVEHRNEKLSSSVDALSLTNSYWAGNYKPINGSFHVSEAFFETVVPLLKDMPFAKTLDLNAAIRATDYSTSGYVTTWKAGLTYEPVDGVRVRLTRSRDIRAPNFSELYAAGQTNTNLISDPFRNNSGTTYFEIKSGNSALKPEKADTTGLGLVVQPKAIPGLSASVDYFDIKIKDAVSTIGSTTIMDQCFRGDASLCSKIVRDASGMLTAINVQPINFARQTVRGLDFEMGYRLSLGDISAKLGDGQFSLRALATRYLKAEYDNGLTAPDSSLGENGSGTPKWQYLVQAAYSSEQVSLSLTGRGVSAGKYNATYLTCSTNCPTSTAANPTIDNNRIAGAFYVDLAGSVALSPQIELYGAIDNLFDKDPPIVASGPSIGSAPYGSSAYFYDLVGRMIRVGLRVKL